MYIRAVLVSWRGDTPRNDRLDLIERGDGVGIGFGLERQVVVDRHREDRDLGQEPVRHRRAPLELTDVVEPVVCTTEDTGSLMFAEIQLFGRWPRHLALRS